MKISIVLGWWSHCCKLSTLFSASMVWHVKLFFKGSWSIISLVILLSSCASTPETFMTETNLPPDTTTIEESYLVNTVTVPSLQMPPPVSATITASPSPMPTFVPDTTITPVPQTSTLASGATITLTPAASPTSTPDTRLTEYYWREWSVVPTFSANTISILNRAKQNKLLDINSFSKVGDCQMLSDTFLGGYARGQYVIPAGMEETVEWFKGSMITESITSHNGLGINSIFNPMFGYAAGYKECGRNETPLSCELNIRRPAVVLIAMGTNWKPQGEISFEKYLRQAVEEILATGALPILSTKADNVEIDWKLNEATARVAYEYDLPVVNVWRAVQDLPNHGLEAPPEDIYLTPDGWMRRNDAWLKTLYAVYLILNEP
jgi:uncharacterized membrane protein